MFLYIPILLTLLLGSPLQATPMTKTLSWLHLEAPLNCPAQFIPKRLCFVTRAKNFSDSESLQIRKKIEQLQALYPAFFKKLLSKRKSISFFRHSFGAQRLSLHSYKQNRHIKGWASPDLGSIHLTDRFFENALRMNEKHDDIDYILIHELSHLIDFSFGHLSRSQKFLSLYDWKQVPDGTSTRFSRLSTANLRWQTMGIPFFEVDAIREEVQKGYQSGEAAYATELSLSYGQRHGHPGSYSMVSPGENFAEIITAFFLDPDTLVTAPNHVHHWLIDFLN